MDVVERLLEPFSHKPNYGFKVEITEAHEATCREAATEIETLRAALKAERERCAVIAETNDDFPEEGAHIAAAIRADAPMPYGEAVDYLLNNCKMWKPT